jgi:hypothetical protein
MYDTYLKELKFKDFTPIQKASFSAYQKNPILSGLHPQVQEKHLRMASQSSITLNQIY